MDEAQAIRIRTRRTGGSNGPYPISNERHKQIRKIADHVLESHRLWWMRSVFHIGRLGRLGVHPGILRLALHHRAA
jgi:hypothetical protein